MSKRTNEPIATWQEGNLVQGFALVRRREVRQDRNGKDYLDLTLADASGSIPAKAWSDSPALSQSFGAGDYVAFVGTVQSYRESPQMKLDNCRRVVEEDRLRGFDEARLIPTTKEDIGELWKRLVRIYAEEIVRPELSRLAAETLAEWGPALREHPAAKAIHHAYRGGLLEHTVSMAGLALAVTGHYQDADRDLVLLGVLFHDLGKLRELQPMPDNDYTLPGRLVGHVVMGRDMLKERVAAIPGFPADLLLLLEHLVLSHQGRKEFSSPVEPMTAEAFVLHFIDDLDSKLAQLRAARDTGSGLVYLRPLERFVYLGPAERKRRLSSAPGGPPAPDADLPTPAPWPAAFER